MVIGTSQAIWAIDNTCRFDKFTYSLFNKNVMQPIISYVYDNMKI